MKMLRNLLLLSLMCAAAQSQTTLKGTTWDGAIRISGIELTIAVKFHAPTDTPAATIDIPQQSAFGLPLTRVIQTLPRVHFELPAGPGLATFEGTLVADSITGVFMQAGQMGTFFLFPHKAGETAVPPSEPVPYKQEEVSFQNGAVTLAGTLTLPPSRGRHPAIVMLTGSGPQNRDEEVFGFRPFKIIADALTRKGIAVLRYDDRGVGGSTGSMAKATTEDFAGDALAAVHYLQGRNDIDTHQIGLCGHSEGAIAAPIAADRSRDVAFLLLLAGPGVPGDTLVLSQLVTLMRSGGASENEIRDALAMEHRILAAVRTGEGWNEVRSSMNEEIAASMRKMTPEQRSALGDSTEFVASTIEAKLRQVQSPWFNFFVTYDPARTLRRIHSPVLALFGELDMQVPPGIAMPPLENALREGGNHDVTVRVLPKANHLFQEAKTGLPSEYGLLKKEFVPGFLDTVTAWVDAHVRVAKK